jgi:putative oxidoreductase
METSVATAKSPQSGICVISLFQRAYRLLICAASLLQSPLLLAIRLYWGWQFFQTGKGKLMNHEKVTMFFDSLHIPFPSLNAYVAGTTETIGGLLLVIGLGSRLVSLPLIFTLSIAYLTAESDALKSIFSDPDKFVSAAPFLFLLACLVILAFGPGKISVDWLLGKKFSGRQNTH